MEVILELGGNPSRIYRVIELAQQYPSAQIVISSEGSPDLVVGLLRGAGITDARFILDFKAWDTVTNFTHTLQLVRSYVPGTLYVVTDQFHMKRAMAIARAVYFLRGIKVVPVPYMGSEPHPPESGELIRYDQMRSWIWRLTGYLQYDKAVKDQRMPGIEADEQHARQQGYPVSK